MRDRKARIPFLHPLVEDWRRDPRPGLPIIRGILGRLAGQSAGQPRSILDDMEPR